MNFKSLREDTTAIARELACFMWGIETGNIS